MVKAAHDLLISYYMKDQATVQRFIELRAQGWAFQRLATELNVSKSTLIDWSRKYQFQIQNLKAIELEALSHRWLASTTERVNGLGERLHKIEEELAKRDTAELKTPQLYALAGNLRRQIQQAIGPMRFSTPVSEIPPGEFTDSVQDWQP